jgi:hypothetical protein
MTWLLHPHETDTVSTVQESGWGSGPAWIGLVNLTPPEFELLTLQFVGSCYIYYAIPPPLMSVTSKKAKQHQVIIMLVAASSYSNTHPLLILVVSKILLHSFPSLATASQFLILTIFQSSSTSSLHIFFFFSLPA